MRLVTSRSSRKEAQETRHPADTLVERVGNPQRTVGVKVQPRGTVELRGLGVALITRETGSSANDGGDRTVRIDTPDHAVAVVGDVQIAIRRETQVVR